MKQNPVHAQAGRNTRRQMGGREEERRRFVGESPDKVPIRSG
jgi:hypothetical protein